MTKSYGYPAEWKIPAKNARLSNQPGGYMKRGAPMWPEATQDKRMQQAHSEFSEMLRGTPGVSPEDRTSKRNKDWLRSVQLEQMAKGKRRR